ncbi:hypothetical protein O9993_11425 [Vibrio lentus]|nr:hypothetical protein [Vibrio lentus]
MHKWKNTEFQTYSRQNTGQVLLVNRYTKQADYYLRIDDKEFQTRSNWMQTKEMSWISMLRHH